MNAAILTVTPNPSIDIAATTERVTVEHKLRCESVQRDPGGGGLNVARVLTRFGYRCQALYPAGGALGGLLQRLLADHGVSSLVIPVQSETRESFTVVERCSGREYRFVLPGSPLHEPEWQACLDAVRTVEPVPAWVVASGSLPAGMPVDFYARVAEIARARGARIAVDASGPALAAALEVGVNLAKPNLRELRELTGHRLEHEHEWVQTLRSLIQAGKAHTIALSAGPHGALAVSADECLRAAAIPVQVASSVGAGDSFLSGLVMKLADGSDLENALRHGVAAGTAALLEWGTSLADPQRVAELREQVLIERR